MKIESKWKSNNYISKHKISGTKIFLKVLSILLAQMPEMIVLLPMVASNIFKLDAWKITLQEFEEFKAKNYITKREDKGMICYNKES